MKSISADPEGSFLLITNENVEVFDFDPQQTFMIAYAIDDQTSPRFSHRTLSAATVSDAYQVCTAFIDKMVVPKENVKLFTASKDPDLCTIDGMKRSFLEQARRVGTKGLFLFHFSGHGIKVGNEWGLAPSDFDYTDVTYLSAPILSHWLAEAGCQAPWVLFTLDCCYAGGLGEELTARDVELRPGLYVLSACTAFETSLIIGPLGHSIFAYFLAYAIRVLKFPPGKLPVSQIFKECGALCTALSSLLISYSPSYGLKFGTMQPELRYFDPQHSVAKWVAESLKPVELGPVHAKPGRYSFVTKYYQSYGERGLQRHQLSELCLMWLESIADYKSPLGEIAKRGILRDEILRAAVCSLMWSVASIQVEEDRTNVNDPNLFLLAFIHAAAAFDCFHGIELGLEHLREGWGFYQAVVAANKIDDSELQQLFKEITKDWKISKGELKQLDTIEEVSIEMESLSMQSVKVYTRVNLHSVCILTFVCCCIRQAARGKSIGQAARGKSIGQAARGKSIGQAARGKSIGQAGRGKSVGTHCVLLSHAAAAASGQY